MGFLFHFWAVLLLKTRIFAPLKPSPAPKWSSAAPAQHLCSPKRRFCSKMRIFYPSARIFEAKKGWIGFLKRRFWVKIGVFLHSEGSSQLQNGGFQPQNGGSGEEPQLCAPKSAFFTSKSPLCLWNSLFLISIFFLIGQMGDFCPKKRRFRPRNLRFFPPQCCFLCFKNPFLPPKFISTPKPSLLPPKLVFYFSLNVHFCPEIAVFSPKFASLCPQTAFPAPWRDFFRPKPKSLFSQKPQIGVFSPKLGFFFSVGKGGVEPKLWFWRRKKGVFFLQKILVLKRSNLLSKIEF